MDIATVGGLGGCAAAVVYGIVSGDQGFAALGNFWDMPSFLIVVIGALMPIKNVLREPIHPPIPSDWINIHIKAPITTMRKDGISQKFPSAANP